MVGLADTLEARAMRVEQTVCEQLRHEDFIEHAADDRGVIADGRKSRDGLQRRSKLAQRSRQRLEAAPDNP